MKGREQDPLGLSARLSSHRAALGPSFSSLPGAKGGELPWTKDKNSQDRAALVQRQLRLTVTKFQDAKAHRALPSRHWREALGASAVNSKQTAPAKSTEQGTRLGGTGAPLPPRSGCDGLTGWA